MMTQTADGGLVLSVPPERVELARRTHRSVTVTFVILYVLLGAVIITMGAFLASRGRASLTGTLIVGGVFILFPLLVGYLNNRSLKQAMARVSTDGTTQMVVNADGVRIADTFVPYERITFAAAFVQGEEYSNGDLRGEVMAARLNMTDDRPTAGRAVGAIIGTAQRKKLYRDGAKSTISLSIGVDRRSTIDSPEGMINPLKTLPQRGDEPGRIDMPFGAFLNTQELEAALGAMYRFSGGQQFPIGIVGDALEWGSGQATAAEPRDEISKTFTGYFAPRA